MYSIFLAKLLSYLSLLDKNSYARCFDIYKWKIIIFGRWEIYYSVIEQNAVGPSCKLKGYPDFKSSSKKTDSVLAVSLIRYLTGTNILLLDIEQGDTFVVAFERMHLKSHQNRLETWIRNGE